MLLNMLDSSEITYKTENINSNKMGMWVAEMRPQTMQKVKVIISASPKFVRNYYNNASLVFKIE